MDSLAFGGHAEGDAEMKPGWWTDYPRVFAASCGGVVWSTL